MARPVVLHELVDQVGQLGAARDAVVVEKVQCGYVAQLEGPTELTPQAWAPKALLARATSGSSRRMRT